MSEKKVLKAGDRCEFFCGEDKVAGTIVKVNKYPNKVTYDIKYEIVDNDIDEEDVIPIND